VCTNLIYPQRPFDEYRKIDIGDFGSTWTLNPCLEIEEGQAVDPGVLAENLAVLNPEKTVLDSTLL